MSTAQIVVALVSSVLVWGISRWAIGRAYDRGVRVGRTER